MPADKPVVLDTNILFSALLKRESKFAQTILSSSRAFCLGESVIVELFKHKEKIEQFSKLSEGEVAKFLSLLLRRVTILKEDLITHSSREKAVELCKDIDEADTPHVALTLHINGQLWTGDSRLKKHLLSRGFDAFFEPE